MFAMKMNVSIILNIILEQYFDYQRCLMIVKDQESNLTYKGKHQIVEISIDDNFYYNSSLIDEIIHKFEFGCGGFVIDTEKPAEMFEYIEKQIRLSFVRYNRRRYIINVRKNIENFKEMFGNDPGLRFVSDLLFLVELNSHKFQLWSFDFLGDEDTIRFKLVDTWMTKNNAFRHGNNLYPDKFQNQHGRVLRLACFYYPPYTNCGNQTYITGYFGTELVLAIEFAKLHNMTPRFVYNKIEKELWGTLHPNWTGLGLMGIAVRDEADIAFTAFFIWEFVNQYLDMTIPYLRSGITCLVPKPDILDGWVTPLLSFQVSLWFFVILNFVLNSFSIFFLVLQVKQENTGSTNSSYNLLDSFWIMLKISLGQTHQSNNNSSRILFSILFLAYLILNSTYFCGLASIMTIPRYEDPIDSLTSLANSDVEIRGIFEDWVLSIKEIHEEPYTQIVERYKAAPKDELRELSKQDDYAFFLERLSYNNYGINDFIKDDVIENYHLMKGDVYWEYTEFFLRKSSVLAPRYDMFILHVLQSGLPSYWQKKAVNHFMDSRVQKIATMMENALIRQDEVVKLKFSHVEGCFGFLFIGYFLSATALLIERLMHYKRGSKKYCFE